MSATRTGAPQIQLHRPLVSLWTALALIGGERPEQIITLIEQGNLRWAFDIGTKGAKREIRILGKSILEYLAARATPGAEDFNAAVKTVFPMPEWLIPAARIAYAWSTSPDHILNLCRGRELHFAKGPSGRPRRGREAPLWSRLGAQLRFCDEGKYEIGPKSFIGRQGRKGMADTFRRRKGPIQATQGHLQANYKRV